MSSLAMENMLMVLSTLVIMVCVYGLVSWFKEWLDS